MKTNLLTVWCVALAAALAMLVTGCAGKQVKEQTLEEVSRIDECFYPDVPDQKAPLWVCGASIEGLAMHAVGIAEQSQAGFGFMRQLAATDARTQMAQQMQVQVQNMIKSFAETTGQGDTETVDRVNTLVTKQITDESLVGSRVIRYISSPNQTLYVLVGMDEASVRQSAQGAVSSSVRDDNAAWQQFQADRGQEELANSIANQPLN